MYVPQAFQETDEARLFDFVETHSFGLLVSTLEDQWFATHLPLLVDRHAAPHGRLVGHMARANPHWRELAGQQVLVVFSGPHAYISPRWYEAQDKTVGDCPDFAESCPQTGTVPLSPDGFVRKLDNVVPTWNYVAVHAYGRARLIDDEQALGEILERTVATYERGLPEPWSVDRQTDFFARLAKMVVGFEIEINRLEGKWKLGQNHPPAWRANAARQLAQNGSYDADQIARLMNETLR